MSADPLELVLDEVLPGGEGFPAASAIDLAAWFRTREDFVASCETILSALPSAFAKVDRAQRITMLQAVEQAHPEAFGRFLVGAYSGYYVHADVLAVIARQTSYPGRPPQPEGYALKPFDPDLLDTVRRRPRSYREA